MRCDKALPLVVVVLVLAAAVLPSAARKIRVRHNVGKEKTSRSVDVDAAPELRTLSPDSVGWTDVSAKIRLYGYDKTVNSSKESLFVVNGLDSCDVAGVVMELTYTDTRGRQLHRRQVDVDCMIPSGETRRVDFPTWDSQKVFYYVKSVAPKKQATPFEVKVSLKSLRVSAQTSAHAP